MRRYAPHALLATLALLAAGTAVLTALVLWPWEPTRISGARVVDTPVCPDDPVRVSVVADIRPGYGVLEGTLESSWRPVGGGSPEGAGTAKLYDLVPTPGPVERASEALRSAPKMPGRYRLVNETEIRGALPGWPFRGFPKYQRLEYESENLLTVLEPGDPRCDASEAGG